MTCYQNLSVWYILTYNCQYISGSRNLCYLAKHQMTATLNFQAGCYLQISVNISDFKWHAIEILVSRHMFQGQEIELGYLEMHESCFFDCKFLNGGIRNGVKLLFSILLFYKIDVTLGRRLRKLHVSTWTAAVFTRIIYNWITQQLANLIES